MRAHLLWAHTCENTVKVRVCVDLCACVVCVCLVGPNRGYILLSWTARPDGIGHIWHGEVLSSHTQPSWKPKTTNLFKGSRRETAAPSSTPCPAPESQQHRVIPHWMGGGGGGWHSRGSQCTKYHVRSLRVCEGTNVNLPSHLFEWPTPQRLQVNVWFRVERVNSPPAINPPR